MQRRIVLQSMALAGAMGALPLISSRSLAAAGAESSSGQVSSGPVSVEQLPPLEGKLTLYLGRGEGGLYENVMKAIEKRNPKLELAIRRGPTAALANTIVAEAKAGVLRADLFWAVDSGAIGVVTGEGLAKPLPQDLVNQLNPTFRYPNWSPVTGRIRTLPYNTTRLSAAQIPNDVMALADSDLSLGWAPAYASFQSFVTAMRILKGDDVTVQWLQAVNKKAKRYAGELGVVMAVERGEVDVGFANHYYTLRLKAGKPDARVDLAFTNNDAGCLVNASGIVALNENDTTINFIRYLLTREVQSYLASEAYEIPMVAGVAPPPGLPSLETVSPPDVPLTRLGNLRPTLDLMRKAGVL